MQSESERRTKKADLYSRLIREQRAWIEDHGGSLAGYIERYGIPGSLKCYGNGGYAIYHADMAAMGYYERKLIAAMPLPSPGRA